MQHIAKLIFRIVAVGALVVLIGFVIQPFSGFVSTDERAWAQPWELARNRSEALCNTLSDDDERYYGRCLEIEKVSYDKLQGNLGLPDQMADEIKSSCAEFGHFTTQWRCVRKKLEPEAG